MDKEHQIKILLQKLGINDDLNDYIIASCSLKETDLNTIKNENQISLITGPFETNPQNEPTKNYLAP